jgi:hypothetical protein
LTANLAPGLSKDTFDGTLRLTLVNLLALPNIECLLIVSGMLTALSHLGRVLGKKKEGGATFPKI